jgi:hypothetical protein
MATTDTATGARAVALEALREDGIAVVRFTDLFDQSLWDEAVADMEPFISESREKAGSLGDKPAGKEEVIFRRFWDKASGTAPELSIDSPWLRITASDDLLGIVNEYRSTQTHLFYVDNWFTPNYPGATKRVASQRWHRDPEHEHVVKLFVYFSDVDDGSGPFEYVRSSSTGGRYGDLWKHGTSDEWYPPEDELEAAVAPEDRLTMKGPKGTLVLCDTGGFHRGGFAKDSPRILTVATYLEPDLKGKYGDARFRVDYAGKQDSLSPAQRAALPAL